MNVELSYIVVCFNSAKYIQQCVNSILEQSHTNCEIYVVDNNSDDDTTTIAKNLYERNPKIHLISNSTNIGYGNAISNIIPKLKGQFIAILNADTFLDRYWAENMLNVLYSDDRIITVLGKILFPNGELQSTGGLMDKYGAVTQRKSDVPHLKNMDDCFFYADGSAFMIKRKIFNEISFDPKLFLYYEDVDFSWKIRMLGYMIKYVPTAISYHDSGHSSHDINLTKFYYITRNRMFICQKNYSIKNCFFRMPIIICLLFINAVFYDLVKNKKGYLLHFVKALSWNLTNIPFMLKERKRLQSSSKITDLDLDKYITKNSIELSNFKSISSFFYK